VKQSRKNQHFPIAWISAAVAVLLWLVASWFEDDTRWLPDVPEATQALAVPSPRDDTPLRTNTDALSCQQTEESLIDRVRSSQYCATDDDCTLFDYGYPIQCLTSVSKTEITALRRAYRHYEDSCAYRVYYDCPSGEMERQAVCRSNRCEVELVSIDPLEAETLQHLGIKDL
jgi:hypothetical protein